MSEVCDRRIFIVSPTESELTMRGKRHPNLARFLSYRGWQVIYLSSNFYHAEKRLFSDDEYRQAVKHLPYQLHLVNVGKYRKNLSLKRVLWNARFAYHCYRKLKNILTEKDILIIPSRPPELVYVGGVLKKKCSCRVVLDIRDVWPDMLRDVSRSIIIGFKIYCNFFLQNSLPLIDEFIHVAPSFIPWLRRYVVDAESTFIPLGFDENRWGVDPPKCQHSQNEVIKMVFCGTLSNQLNILPVLKALVIQPQGFKLTLIGDNGTGARYSEVINFIERSNLTSTVTVKGLMSPEKLVQEFSQYDLSIIPMISGALPNKFFDSIATGIPIISLGKGDCSSLIERFDIGWTVSFEPDSINKLFGSLTQKQIRTKAKNIIKVRSEFMQRNLYIKYEELLRKLL